MQFRRIQKMLSRANFFFQTFRTILFVENGRIIGMTFALENGMKVTLPLCIHLLTAYSFAV